MFLIFSKKEAHYKGHHGFTLIELLIVIAIVIIISTVVLAGYDDYQFRSALTIAKEELAVTLREAQVYGIAIRGAQNGATYSFPNYGVHVHPVTYPNAIIIFTDVDRTPASDIGFNTPGDTEISRYTIKPPHTLEKVCVNTTANIANEECTGSGPTAKIDILFERPEPEPTINSKNSGNTLLITGALYTSIYITGPDVIGSHYVRIWNNGQISVLP